MEEVLEKEVSGKKLKKDVGIAEAIEKKGETKTQKKDSSSSEPEGKQKVYSTERLLIKCID